MQSGPDLRAGRDQLVLGGEEVPERQFSSDSSRSPGLPPFPQHLPGWGAPHSGLASLEIFSVSR